MITALIILGMVLALAIGIYVGMGAPGTRGPEDRIITHGRARRLPKRHIDWLKSRHR